MIKYIKIWLLLGCLIPVALNAQGGVDEPEGVLMEEEAVFEEEYTGEAAPVAAYQPRQENPPPAYRDVQESQWEKAAGALDYSKDVEKPPKPPKEERRPNPTDTSPNSGGGWNLDGQFWGSLLQILAVVLAIAGIAWGVYSMLQQPRNKNIARDGVEITVDNIEEYIHETDLERFLREALARQDYAQAVRLYYLQVIKSLSEKNAIRWSREKTNRDYLRDLRQHRLSDAFKKATLTYELVWYGNVRLEADAFARLEPEFKSLLGSI